MAYSYEKQPFIDVDHTHGAAVQDYAHKIVLNANNFDFSQARADLYDVQFADELGNVLPHYLYHYDASRGQAVLFVKMNLQAGERKSVTLRWGDPTAGVDPSDSGVCVYANRLATSGDLAEFTTTFGSLAAAVVVDANAPKGAAIEFIGGTDHAGLLVAQDLPETYESWLMEAENVGQGTGAYAGALVEAADASHWYRVGRWDGTGAANIHDRNADVWNYSNIAPGEFPADGDYVMQQTLVGPAHRLVEASSFTVPNGVQGLAYHSGVGLIYTSSDDIYRVGLDGVEQEALTPTVLGTSFGDCQIVDLGDGLGLQCYVTRFDEVTPQSTIYRFDPLDLASGITLVADISSSFPGTQSINALSFDPKRRRWFVGTTKTSYVRCDFYEFSEDFGTSYGRIDAHEADIGFQSSDFSRGMLVASEHTASTSQDKTFWQTHALDESARIAHATHSLYPLSSDGQGIAYDPSRDVWYVLNRMSNPNEIRTLRLEVDDTQRQITGRWGYNAGSIGSACLHDQVLAAPQSQVGVGAYRACRVANLAYLKTTFPLPVNRLPASSNSAVFPTPSEVVSVADTQHAVSV